MRKALHTSMGWTNGIANALRRYSLVHTAAIGAVALGAAGQATAQPEPPRFEAHVIDPVEPRKGFRVDGYKVWSIADDGTVYGSAVKDAFSRYEYKAIKWRLGEGTTWLLPRDPAVVELRPIAPSVSGTVLLTIAPGYDYIYVPNHGIRRLNNLHPNIFFPDDMNNRHEITGAVGVAPNNRGVNYRQTTGFEYFKEERSSGDSINDRGSVLGHLGGGGEGIDMRVWHSDGRISDFVLPTTSGQGPQSFNETDEGCGTYHRRDSTGQLRDGGWFWSERTGLVEIPFRRQGTFRDVSVFGISDDGWVLGKEDEPGGAGIEYFLWHVDAGFFDLGDLYPWEGRFQYPADGHDGAINSVGQMVVPTYSLQSERTVYVFLNPVK